MLKTLLSHTVKEVQPEDCNTNNITYLDARELQEYNVSHLNNAIWCGYNNFKIKKTEFSEGFEGVSVETLWDDAKLGFFHLTDRFKPIRFVFLNRNPVERRFPPSPRPRGYR